MAARTQTDLGQKAWRAFHKIRIQLLPSLVRHLNEECGMSEAEYQVFVGLQSSENGQFKPSQLAEEIGWDLGRLSHQVSRMESKGLLVKQQCPVDARSCWVGATKKGQALFDKALPRQIREVERLFSDALTNDQKRSLIEISEAIEAHLKKVPSK
jgi:DNA-binding MarR family transcriptional regulator